ncbi:related to Cyanamide hydratase [Ramularia collo-cygni]|uniref:Related to Cyanamide hydratase n=1 Tax=Ramularia collo-cygni TaxID=112498 RepID=A0A2D3VBQ4_9PEZI|nr:related to Cyanamide hydratase [Ramularia collo-cygni]CZT25523.1 related to Cyanamide hydratase [Ramularia collo-cygni]
MAESNIHDQFGWTSVPRNRSNVPSDDKVTANAVKVNFEGVWPKTSVVNEAQAYAKMHLSEQTYNHSLRVYYYGHTIVTQNFPQWNIGSFMETWALTCLFHDIGTTSENRAATHLSFEFQGGFIALKELQSFGAPLPQAESVCEAIIRHQDPGETGTVSRMVQLIQISTELDNMGWQPHLVHLDVIEQIVKRHPRMKWSSCFSSTIEDEINAKPWCHTTALDGFAEAVATNKLMEPYD